MLFWVNIYHSKKGVWLFSRTAILKNVKIISLMTGGLTGFEPARVSFNFLPLPYGGGTSPSEAFVFTDIGFFGIKTLVPHRCGMKH